MMRLDDRLRGGEPIVSFEFLPPRTVEAELAFWARDRGAARRSSPRSSRSPAARAGRPATSRSRVVRRLARERGLEAVPHVTATGFTREGLVELLAEARAGGADNVLALRGDPPRGESTWTRARGRRRELARADRARRRGRLLRARRRLPGAAPGLARLDADLAHLRAKVDAGVRVLVTQLFFDNDDYRRFVDRLRAAGIDVPVLPGIIPVTSIAQIERDRRALRREHPGRRCGASSSARQDDPRAVAELGVAYATAQAAELLADGAPGVHLYTLNRSPATRAIVSALRAHGALPPPPSLA